MGEHSTAFVCFFVCFFFFFCWGRGNAVHGVPSLEVRRLV